MNYPVYQPSLTGNEKRYVNECLDTAWISCKGHFVTDFENAFADFIGDNVFLGAGTTVKDGVEICSDVVVGAGSCVVKNIEQSGIYIGIPAKSKHQV